MSIVKKLLISGLLIISSKVLVAQEDPIDHLRDSLIRERHVKELRVDLRSINFDSDTTYFLEIQRFDKRGNKIESIAPLPQNRYQRYVEAYDSLNRRILSREYSEIDTTRFHTEKKWIFPDSSHYRQEVYVEGKKVVYYEVTSKSVKDTNWVTEDEYGAKYHYHRMSRERSFGDSLKIIDYLKYDKQGHLNGIDSYYTLRRDLDTGMLILEGRWMVKQSEWDRYYDDIDLMRDYYAHPEKHVQLQLDDQFEMEYDDPFIYKVYNLKGQFVQDGDGSSKITFTYNAKGQLTQKIGWGMKEGEEYSDPIPKFYTEYEYNELGLPVKSTRSTVNDASKRITMYSYSYW